TPVNDAPVVDLDLGNAGSVDMATSATYIEGSLAQPVLIAGVAVTDADSTLLSGGTIVLASHPDGAAETLAFSGSVPGITATWNQSTWTMTLVGTTGLAQYQQILGSLTYIDTSENPASSVRSITVTLSDDSLPTPLASPVATALVQVQPVNDAPVLTVSV